MKTRGAQVFDERGGGLSCGDITDMGASSEIKKLDVNIQLSKIY